MRNISFLLAVFLLSVFQIVAQDATEGSLFALNKKGKELGACPLKHTSVKTDISGFLARVTVSQEFENNFAEPIEAVYTFPLSQNSAVDDMTMKIGTRTIRGKIMKREEARKIYEQAKTEGKTASLLDQERPNIFTQAVANILPNEKIVIEISYVETLKYEDGGYEFVFPMTVAPRYIPGSVKDAQKISPPIAATRAGHDISIEVNLDAGVPIEEIRSNSHQVEAINLSPNNAKITLKDEDKIPNKDFVLRYDVTGKRIEDAILTHRMERGGFFTLILQPPDKFQTEDVTPKEIVFVLDTSGSMSGFPIEKAKEAMKLSLEGLYPNDTFNLITFAGDTAILFDKPVLATQANLEKAQAFLESRQGSGGTEMMTAIKAALEPSDATDHLRIVCFMTDGVVGNDAEIIAEVQKHKNARVFSFGIGSSVNRFLLDKIAEEGNGEAEYVALTDDGSKAAKKFYERVRTPLLTDISIDWNGLPVADVYPNRIRDLFSAKPVTLHGRYTKAASGTIRLKGKVSGQDFVREIPVNLPESESENDVLATLWARTRIDELTKQDYNNTKPEIQQTITNIGLEYRLLTQFTSFVTVEEVIRTVGGQPKTVEVPVNLPEGMSDEADSQIRRRDFELKQPVASTQGKKGIKPTDKRYRNPNTSLSGISSNGRGKSGGQGEGSGDGQGTGRGSGNGSGKGSGSGIGSGSGSGNGSPAIAGIIFSRTITNTTSSPAPPPPKTISGGVINGKAIVLIKPTYPPAARAVRANGAVNVQITIDESGNVISASAVSGHPLLRQAAEQAAKQSKFMPIMLSGQPIKVTGIIVYNFVNPQDAGNINVSVGNMNFSGNNVETKDEQKLPITPEMKAETERREKEAKYRQMIADKFHFWVFALVERWQKGETALTANDAKFVKDSKADVQIWLTAKSPEAIEKLKNLGFSIVDDKNAKFIVGRIAVEKLVNLAEIAEVQYVLPSVK